MGYGLLIDYNDGQKPLEITSGLRMPSWCAQVGMGNVHQGNTIGVTRTPGSQLACIINDPIFTNDFDQSAWPLPGIYTWTGFNDNGGTVSFNMMSIHGNGLKGWWWPACTVYEVQPATDRVSGFGLLVADSTDFTAVTDNSRAYSCVWSGDVHINGNWVMPVDGIPFARWSSPNTTLAFDGGRTLTCRNTDYTGRDDLGGEIDARVLIFQRVPPVPGNGLNIINSAGQCTFSTTKKPFVYKKVIYISGGWQDCNGFIQLQRCGVWCDYIGGYQNLRWKGIKMFNGQVLSDRNQVQGNYRNQYGHIYHNSDIGLPLAVLPDIY